MEAGAVVAGLPLGKEKLLVLLSIEEEGAADDPWLN
jgi:hypothetical protein